MSQRSAFLATAQDFQIILDIIISLGAKTLNGSEISLDYLHQSRDITLYFPQYGHLNFWPEKIDLTDYPENSERWRTAVLVEADQTTHSGKKRIDSDASPIASLVIPRFEKNIYWTSGAIGFQGRNIKQNLPEFYKVVGKINHRLSKFELVYSSKTKENKFPNQICLTGIYQKLHALPHAYSHLKNGGIFADYYCSEMEIQKFLNNLNIPGIGLP